MSAFAQLHASIFEAAKTNLKRTGDLSPVGILAKESNKHINTIPFQWRNDEEKARNMAAFGATVFLSEADYAFAVLDVCIGTQEEFDRGIRPVEKPMDDRQEAVIVIGIEIHPTITHSARAVQYKRSGPDMKTITFKEAMKFSGKAAFDGNLVDWFKDGYQIAKWNLEHPKADALVCEHGRRIGQPCPHCEGTNDKPV